MKKHVLFIHGGGAGAYAADEQLAAYLRDALGATYQVLYPKMPNEDNPVYAAWKAQIDQELATLDNEVILVGHSVGGSVLLKYLSETQVETPIAGLFLIAAPYSGDGGWQVDEDGLRDDFAATLPNIPRIFFYHSRDDDTAPFAHLALYADKLPQATIRAFDTGGHQFTNNLSEVIKDIKQ